MQSVHSNCTDRNAYPVVYSHTSTHVYAYIYRNPNQYADIYTDVYPDTHTHTYTSSNHILLLGTRCECGRTIEFGSQGLASYSGE
jgi:hypothetical protein